MCLKVTPGQTSVAELSQFMKQAKGGEVRGRLKDGVIELYVKDPKAAGRKLSEEESSLDDKAFMYARQAFYEALVTDYGEEMADHIFTNGPIRCAMFTRDKKPDGSGSPALDASVLTNAVNIAEEKVAFAARQKKAKDAGAARQRPPPPSYRPQPPPSGPPPRSVATKGFDLDNLKLDEDDDEDVQGSPENVEDSPRLSGQENIDEFFDKLSQDPDAQKYLVRDDKDEALVDDETDETDENVDDDFDRDRIDRDLFDFVNKALLKKKEMAALGPQDFVVKRQNHNADAATYFLKNLNVYRIENLDQVIDMARPVDWGDSPFTSDLEALRKAAPDAIRQEFRDYPEPISAGDGRTVTMLAAYAVRKLMRRQ